MLAYEFPSIPAQGGIGRAGQISIRFLAAAIPKRFHPLFFVLFSYLRLRFSMIFIFKPLAAVAAVPRG